MISQISRSASDDQPNAAFPEIPPKQIACQIQTILESVVTNTLSRDNLELKLAVHQPTALSFASSILTYLFRERFIEVEEVEREALSFFKLFLLRRGHRGFEDLMLETLRLLADKLDKSIDNEPLVSRAINFLGVCANWNSGARPQRAFLVDNRHFATKTTFDKDTDSSRLFLNRDFTAILSFRVDAAALAADGGVASLFSFTNEYTEHGYSLYLQNDTLWFRHMLPIKGPEMITEFKVIERVSELIGSDWAVLIFQVQYSSSQKSVSLRFQLNNKVYLTAKSLEDAFARSTRQTLAVVNNCLAELSLVAVINRALPASQIQAVQSLLTGKGLTSLESFDIFSRLFGETVETDGFWVFLHPFCQLTTEGGEWVASDWLAPRKWNFGSANPLWEVSGKQMRNGLLRTRYFESILALMNFAKTEEDFAGLLKIIRQFFSNPDIQTAIAATPKHFCQELVAALVATKKGPFFSKWAVEAIFYVIKSQSDKVVPVFCRNLLFEFNFLDKTLASDAVVSVFFEETTKMFNSNLNLFLGMDFNRLFESALLLLNQGTNLSHLKAFCVLKLISQAMKLGDCADRFRIELSLRYFFGAVANQSLINANVLKIVRLFVKHKQIDRANQKLFSSALVAMLWKTDDGILLSKVFKLLAASKVGTEAVLVSLWRRKAVDEGASDKTKKLFWVYQNQPCRIKNVEQFVQFLFRRTFKGASKTKPFDFTGCEPDPNGYLNFLLEASLSADLEVIDQLLSGFTAQASIKGGAFIDFAGKSLILHWLVALLFRLARRREDLERFEVALRLLRTFCLSRYKLHGQIDWLNTLSELVAFYTMETKNEKLKFTIINAILNELNSDGVIFESKTLVSFFLLFGFKFYFTNLTDGYGDEAYLEFAREFLALAHRTVNLNPLPSLPLDLTEDIPTIFNERNRLITSLINSTTFLSGGVEAVKDGFICPLKLLVLMVSDILDALVSRRDDQPKIDFVYEFVNAFVYRVNYFLENNRKKLKADRVYLLESLAFHLISFSLRTPQTFPYLKDMVEGVFYFVGKSSTDQSLNSKILKDLRVGQYTKPTEFFHSLKFEGVARPLTLPDFVSKDLNEGRQEFLLAAFGRINEAMTASGVALSDDLFAGGQRSDFREYLENETGQQQYDQLLNAIFFKEFNRNSKLNFVYRALYKHQFEENQPLFNHQAAEKAHFKFQFDPKDFDFDAQKGKIVQFKTVDFVTRGFKRPFVRSKFTLGTPNIAFPKEPPLPPNFSMADWVSQKGAQWYFCDRVDGLYAVPSCLVIDDKKPALWIFLNLESTAESLTIKFGIDFKKYHRKPWHKCSMKIPAEKIRAVHLFKYLNQRKAVMIQLADYRHVLLHFAQESQATQVIAALQVLATRGVATDFGGSAGIAKPTTPQRLVEEWLAHKISNFDFLMQLNIFGSRSWVDYSQYPVFPLLIKKFDQMITLRDLEKPMGLNADDKCIASYQRTFDVSNPTDEKGFFYGSHYSYPASVFNLLIRRHPESQGSRSVHNNTYDFPDRIFFSVLIMVRNIMEDPADVRELIPEFFYLPEMFLNINNFDFGSGQHGQRVHNVQLPEMSRGNPYLFVCTLRQLLESPLVSLKLGSWVDLIFGAKQFGQKAVEAKNVFFPVTYEQNFRSLKMDSPEELNAKMNQIFNFGQTPGQLFTKPIGNRKVTAEQQTLGSADSKTRYFLRFREFDAAVLNPLLYAKKITENSVMESKIIKRLVIVKQQTVEIWRFRVTANAKNNLNPYEMFQESTFQTGKIRKAFLAAGGSSQHQSTIEFASDSRLILGGICNGSVLLVNFKTDKVLSRQPLHEQLVTHLLFVTETQFLSADVGGVVRLSAFDSKSGTLTPLSTCHCFGPSPFLGITVCRDDKRLLCFNTEQAIEIRSLDALSAPLFTLLKKNLPMLPPHPKELLITAAYLSLNYVSCVVLYAYFAGRNHLFSFSLLGQLIGHYTLEDSNEPIFATFNFIPDENFRDYLLITNRRGDVIIFDLPFFEQGKKISSNQNNRVCHVATFLKKKLAMIVDERGYVDILSTSSPNEV